MPVRVLISYSHDSSKHADRVLDFANQLREHGVDAWIDQYEPVPKQGWPAWMQKQIERADYVLCVCTEEYKRRFNDEVETGVGRGVSWEANLIRNAIFNSKATQNIKFLVVQFDQHNPKNVPTPLQGYAVFSLNSFQIEHPKYVALYRHLTSQPEVEAPAIGRIVNLQPRDRKSEGAPGEINIKEALSNPQLLPVTDRPIVESEVLANESRKAQNIQATHSQSTVSSEVVREKRKTAELYTKFREVDGQLCPLSKGKRPAYWVELWIEGAPRETNRVDYEILDVGFKPNSWVVNRSTQATRDFLTDDMNAWGNVAIMARGRVDSGDDWTIRSSLYNALTRYYGESQKCVNIQKALEQIKLH